MPTPLNLDVWSDIVCPWCYVGEHRVRKALDALGVTDVRWRFHSFELGPRQQARQPVAQMLAQKYRVPPAEARQMMARVQTLGAELGLDINPDKQYTAASFDAHRLVQAAQAQVEDGSRALAVMDRLHRAYFSEGLDTSDHAVLAGLAAEAGMPKAEAERLLATNAYAQEVEEGERRAQAYEIRGVPFTVVADQWAASGAQPVEAFVAMLKKGLALAGLLLALGGGLRADTVRADYYGSAASLSGSLGYEHSLGQDAPELSLGFTRSRGYGSSADAYSSELTLGADGEIPFGLKGSCELGYEKQDLYNISAWEPGIGVSWRWRGAPDADGLRPTWLKLSGDLDMAFFSMDTKVPAPGGPGPGPGPGGPRTVEKKLTLNKAAAKAKLSAPLFTQRLFGYASYTAYSYSQDPLELTDTALRIQPPDSPLAGRLDSLNSQLLRRAWSFGASLDLWWDWTLSGAFGRSQSVSTDRTGSSIDAALDVPILEDYGVSGGWTRYVEDDGSTLDQGSAGFWASF